MGGNSCSKHAEEFSPSKCWNLWLHFNSLLFMFLLPRPMWKGGRWVAGLAGNLWGQGIWLSAFSLFSWRPVLVYLTTNVQIKLKTSGWTPIPTMLDRRGCKSYPSSAEKFMLFSAKWAAVLGWWCPHSCWLLVPQRLTTYLWVANEASCS